MSLIINPYSFGGFSGILDTYSSAAGAYSVRKLRTAYSGSALRVRRSSDNSESDIGFTSSGDLDESALTTFVGANSAYVTKWYDQSGNGFDFAGSTTGLQPRIVSSGTIDKINNKVAIKFDGSLNSLRSDSLANHFNGEDIPLSSFAVHQIYTTPNKEGYLWGFGEYDYVNYAPLTYRRFTVSARSSNPDAWAYELYVTSWQYSGWGSDIFSVGTTYLSQVISDGTNGSVYANANAAYSTNSNINQGSVAFNEGWLGKTNSVNNNQIYAYIQEIIFYRADKSSDRTGIRDNINTYFGVY